MRNLSLEIEYDGTNYCGWQVQTGHRSQVSGHRFQVTRRRSIQGTIEKTLKRILQEKVKLIASGRTDAGAHAKAQVANFKTHSNIPSDKLQKALNALLPKDISISRVTDVPRNFHSRFQAKSKVYRYTILNRAYPSALLNNKVYFFSHPLDVLIMQKEARCLLGTHNFKSFQASDTKERRASRTIKKIKIAKKNGLIYIDIEANSFLYHMVRNIVGTLIEAGRGRFKPGTIRKILLNCDRRLSGPTIPASGLCLVKVNY